MGAANEEPSRRCRDVPGCRADSAGIDRDAGGFWIGTRRRLCMPEPVAATGESEHVG